MTMKYLASDGAQFEMLGVRAMAQCWPLPYTLNNLVIMLLYLVLILLIAF